MLRSRTWGPTGGIARAIPSARVQLGERLHQRCELGKLARLSGLTIAAGLGFTSPIWMGAVVTVIGLIVLLGATALDRGGDRRVPAAADTALGTPQPAVSNG